MKWDGTSRVLFLSRRATLFLETRLDPNSLHGINFTVYYSSIPCKISLNVIPVNDLSECTSISSPRTVPTLLSLSYLLKGPKKLIFISVKRLAGERGGHWCGWQRQYLFSHTHKHCSVDRRGNAKDLSGSNARDARAINISGNNNRGGGAAPSYRQSSVRVWLTCFWRRVLFWQTGSPSACHTDAASATRSRRGLRHHLQVARRRSAFSFIF